MIEAGSRLSTRSFGPWTTWTAAGRPDADPYTRAHTVRNGLLPLASTLEVTYRAKADSRGGRLHAGCEYAIVMEEPGRAPGGASPPSMARAADPERRGALRLQQRQRHARAGRPGDRHAGARCAAWQLAADRRRQPVNLVLTVQDAGWAAAVYEGSAKALPAIQRLACR